MRRFVGGFSPIHRSAGVALLAASMLLPSASPTRIHAVAPFGPRVLVRFVEGTPADVQVQILREHGAVPVAAIDALDVVVADVPVADPSSTILALFEEPAVASAEADRSRAATVEVGPRAIDPAWALRRIGAPATPLRGFSTLAILATGVDVADPRITGRIMRGWSAFGGGGLDDPNGLGTALAEVAVGAASASVPGGVAPRGVLVMPIQVLDADGVGRDSDIVRGIVEAADRGADTILLGFSGFGYSSALQSAIDYAWDRGAVLVAPVGQDGSAVPVFPAANARVIGVGATTPIDTRWEGSNLGPSVFISAPGQDVPVGRRTVTGTVVAAAIVAASAGILSASDDEARNGTVVARLARGADPVLARPEVGNGRLDLAASSTDASAIGFAPNGVVDGAGGPYVTTFRDTAPPLAGWAREHASFLEGGALPITAGSMPIPVLTSGSSATGAIPVFSLSYGSLATTGPTVAAALRERSLLLGTLIDGAIASDHGAFTYGSVSPPAVAYGVLS